ncbi:MAG: hypothetical protein AAF658_05805, partial [Myxococcota bacterium]
MSISRFESLRPGKDDRCPSDLTLDRFVLGELEGEERDAVARACAECASCQERLAMREAGFDYFKELDADRVFEAAQAAAQQPAKVLAFPKRFVAPLTFSGLVAAAAA